MLYFAFGSNMSLPQMTRRCPSATRRGVGVLAAYRLRFPRLGAVWPGGIADVAPDPEQRVFGVLYEVSVTDLLALDQHEVSYQREEAQIEEWRSARGTARVAAGTHTALLYRVREPLGTFLPGEAYLATMIQGAREAGVPDHYLQILSSFGAD